MSTPTEITDTTARTFLGGEVWALLKSVGISVFIPLVVTIIFAVIVVNIFTYILADSPGPYFNSYGRKLAVAAADAWQNRSQYGYPLGRTFDTLGPLETVLDAIAKSLKKWGDEEIPSFTPGAKRRKQKDSMQANPSNLIHSRPLMLAKPSVHNKRHLGESSGQIRFE